MQNPADSVRSIALNDSPLIRVADGRGFFGLHHHAVAWALPANPKSQGSVPESLFMIRDDLESQSV